MPSNILLAFVLTAGNEDYGTSSADFSCAANTCSVDENTGLLFQALLLKIEKPKLIETRNSDGNKL